MNSTIVMQTLSLVIIRFTICNDNKVASKTKIAMNLGLDEQGVDTLCEFNNYEENIEFSDS